MWLKESECYKSPNKGLWFSYDLSDIDKAKQGCSVCSVKRQCIETMVETEEELVGVWAGMSEYDRLLMSWKKAMSSDESNW